MGANGSNGHSRDGDREVVELIGRAQQHPLGTDFLVNGCLESVAATFGVHAFVVDKARESFPPPAPAPAIGLVPDEAEPARARSAG